MIAISLDDYFGRWPALAPRHVQNAKLLLATVTPLLENARSSGVLLKINPKTGTLVSGDMYGGYRPQSCPVGAPNSAHKTGEAVDVYDPDNALDGWLTDAILEHYNLYREHPKDTIHWCHLTIRRPGSGHRTFQP